MSLHNGHLPPRTSQAISDLRAAEETMAKAWAEGIDLSQSLRRINQARRLVESTIKSLDRTIREIEIRLGKGDDDESDSVCGWCGCDDIETAMWVNVRTEEVVSDTESETYWCPECEEHRDWRDVLTRAKWNDGERAND